MRHSWMLYPAQLAMLSALCTPGFSQQSENHETNHPAEPLAVITSDEAGPQVEVLSLTSELIKGKPYSAESTTDRVQQLPDGNRITHHTISKFYRDSLGRTRREQTFGNVDPAHPAPHEVKIFIDDPITNAAFVLDPREKEAQQLQRTRKFIDEREAESLPKVSKLPPLDEARSISEEDLGSKTIEGVVCNGKKQTITIPAGQVGNEQPIAIVTESWYSSSLEAVVESSTDDPRFGTTKYALHNIQLGEQPPKLFEVPNSFKLTHP